MWKDAQGNILGCGVVLFISAVLLFLNDQIGDFLASSQSLLFLSLIGLPLVLQIATGKVDLASVGRCCIPAGIFVSCLNTIILMGNLASYATIISSIQNAFSPIVLGIIYSYAFSFFRKPNLSHTPHSQNIFWISLIASIIFLGIFLHIFYISGSGAQWGSLFNPISLLIVLSTIIATFIHPDLRGKPSSQKLVSASLFACVISVAFSIVLYAVFISEALGGSLEIGRMGYLMGMIIFPIFYAAISAYVASVSTGLRHMSNAEARRHDWYLVETWLFFALIALPPLSVLEMAQITSSQ